MHIGLSMAIELRHLRQFVAVAEDGHITRAAERLGMQQPPLSQRIKAIETELDVKLFRRKARGVELTEAGRVFFDRARAMIAQYEGSLEATRSAARGEQGRLCVGVMPTAPFHPFVPFVIRAFRAAFPLVSLTLDECLRKEALERLRDDQMDVAFMRAAIALKDLASETFIVYARQLGPAFYEATMAACLKGRVHPSSWPGSAAHHVGAEPCRCWARHYSSASLHAADDDGRHSVSRTEGCLSTESRPQPRSARASSSSRHP